MSRVVAVCAFKGGVGKTTVTANVAAAWSRWGTGAVIDLDPQGNLTKAMGLGKNNRGEYLNPTAEGGARTAADVLMAAGKNSKERLRDEDWSTVLMENEREVMVLEAGDMDALQEAADRLVALPGGEGALKRLLAQVRDEFDWVLIDTPPSSGRLTLNAVVAADSVFAVMNPAYWSQDGGTRIMAYVQDAVEFLAAGAAFQGAIVNRIPGGKRDVIEANLEALDEGAALAGVPVLVTRLPERSSVQAGETLSDPIVSANARDEVSVVFTQLANEMKALVDGQEFIAEVPGAGTKSPKKSAKKSTKKGSPKAAAKSAKKSTKGRR